MTDWPIRFETVLQQLRENEVDLNALDDVAGWFLLRKAGLTAERRERVVGSLLDGASGSASTFLSGTFGESAFGDYPILPGQEIGGASTNYGFMIEFTLSAGDSAGFTASMAIATPAPGALAIFGLGGLARRRRRA
jgi:hypothetical protein